MCWRVLDFLMWDDLMRNERVPVSVCVCLYVGVLVCMCVFRVVCVCWGFRVGGEYNVDGAVSGESQVWRKAVRAWYCDSRCARFSLFHRVPTR